MHIFSAEKLAKEPPDSRFTDWLNPRVQRPMAKSSKGMRDNKGNKTLAELAKSASNDQHTFVVILLQFSMSFLNDLLI